MGGLESLAPGADPDRPVHIVFVGAGAVGCFYASRLHHPSHNIHVSLIARSNYKALTDHGVHLQTHTFGDYTFRPHAVFPSVAAAAANPNPSEAGPREWDYIIVTTKALPDRSDDSALIAPLVGPHSCIVLIQNGVGVEQPYRTRFPTNPIISAVTVISAEQTSPGTVRQNRWTRIHLGPYSNSASFSSSSDDNDNDNVPQHGGGDATTGGGALITPTGSSPPTSTSTSSSSSSSDAINLPLQKTGAHLAALLSDWWTRLGQIRDVDCCADEIALQTIRWHKLCINAAFNPSSVLAGGRGNADMARDPELRRHLGGVMREIWEAAPRILGRGFPASMASPEMILKSSERNVGSKPSMLLDWEGGRPMEVEVILGNPVRIARARGVEMPRLQSVYALVRSMQEVRGRAKGKL
ncbi:ketopantoate reductase PanE/ApbA-domain-containing protein [Chaetomidium leptoderma]|uniref:Ketopantoate reductase PanE/ApbA-domain-containing protein n=1 Tax=Chaetomidium leptoderma TaxID=669021 RepID=A0AAN6VF75_9PEZI|nr:ketopantoate reductase PanE/ApbA-domain-containing protein [Chaetomidium leptoderma]